MKKILSTTTIATVLSVSCAFAADLPTQKAPLVAPAVMPLWTGFYAGLNAGYNWGTNSSTVTQNISPMWGGNNYPIYSAAPLAMGGQQPNTQSGFIGGGQFGFNYQYGANIVIGIETDIQGTIISGNGRSSGIGSVTTVDPTNATNSNTTTAFGSTAVNNGVDYLGTLRGRVGYLFKPNLLVYGTGGFTYGGVYAQTTQVASERFNDRTGFSFGGTPWTGAAQQSALLTGWNAGGGVEWMFMPNWSLKAEALYWSLGNMNIQTSSWAITPASNFFVTNNASLGKTNISYQGVAARAGVNYHFNFASAPVVAKF